MNSAEGEITTIAQDTVPTEVPEDRRDEPVEEHSWWKWLRDRVWPSFEARTRQVEQRLTELNRTIQEYPEAVSAYVLRGEIYLEAGFYDLALADFTRALTLAEQQYKTSDWGVVVQAMQDRARDGLNAARKAKKSR